MKEEEEPEETILLGAAVPVGETGDYDVDLEDDEVVSVAPPPAADQGPAQAREAAPAPRPVVSRGISGNPPVDWSAAAVHGAIVQESSFVADDLERGVCWRDVKGARRRHR